MSALEVLQVRLRTDFRRGLAAGLLAVAALAAGSNLGGLHAPELHVRLIAIGLAAAFAVLGVIATRSAAHGVARAASHTSPGAGSAAQLLCALVGYLVVLGATLGMLTLPWRHLLVGGAITGVIAGIAAQQPLSNLFAGLLLLVARPVVVGQWVRVHSGALGGPLEGTIADISLIYTTLHSDQDVLRIPNAALLGSALRSSPPARQTTAPSESSTDVPGTDVPARDD